MAWKVEFRVVRAEPKGGGASIIVRLTDGPTGKPLQRRRVYLIHVLKLTGEKETNDRGEASFDLPNAKDGDSFSVKDITTGEWVECWVRFASKKLDKASSYTDPFLNIAVHPLNGKTEARVVAWATRKKNGGGVIKNYRIHIEKNGSTIIGVDDWDEEKGWLVDKTGRVNVKLSLTPGDNVFSVFDSVTGVRVKAPTITVPIEKLEPTAFVEKIDLKERGEPGNFFVDVSVLGKKGLIGNKRTLLIIHGSQKEEKKTNVQGFLSLKAKFKEPERWYRVVDEVSGKEAEIWLYN